MKLDQQDRVIAVFGSNNPRDGERLAARRLARAIGRQGAVLLTGGDDDEPGTVKGAAVRAVVDGEAPDRPARWIGIRRAHIAAASQPRGAASVVVTPGWQHRRNFVEAVVCDAAFALGVHSHGTASEALFCLSLGRPVVVLGDVTATQAAPLAMRDVARKRIPSPESGRLAVDRGIARAYQWAAAADREVERVPLPADDAAADALVAALLARVEEPSLRPDLDALIDQTGWDAFLARAIDIRLRP